MSWFRTLLERSLPRRLSRARRAAPRLTVEVLEDRAVPAAFTAASVGDLIADINAANTAGGSNTITLAAGVRFTLTAVDNTTYGATGLPVIAANDDLTLVGNGAILERSSATGTPAFRLLAVAPRAELTVGGATLQGGLASGYRISAEGGAIYNLGTLTLNGMTIQNNTALGFQGITSSGYGFPGGNAAGGGLFSDGTLTLTGCTLQFNTAVGGRGFDGSEVYTGDAGSVGNVGTPGGPGGSAFGGGLCVGGGTATISSTTISSNTAQGGAGGSGYRYQRSVYSDGAGGNGFGGGLSVTGGSVTIHTSSITGNSAAGGSGATRGQAAGGGIYVDAAASLGLDSFTLSHLKKNHASSGGNDVAGSYVVIS
jgi:hypothetical protein